MISAIVAVLSFVTIIVTTSLLVVKGTDLKKQYDDRFRSMSDQMNNANYYNAQVDKQNAQNLTDIRKTYASKDDISKGVDTASISAKNAKVANLSASNFTGENISAKSSVAESLRANKLVSPGGVFGQIETPMLSASRLNLIGDSNGKGSLSFGGDNSYSISRNIEGELKGIDVSMPAGNYFNINSGSDSMSMNPGSGRLSIGKDHSFEKKNGELHLKMPGDSAFRIQSGSNNVAIDASKGSIVFGENNYVARSNAGIEFAGASGGSFGFKNGAKKMEIRPASGHITFDDKTKLGKLESANQMGEVYDSMGVSFDNKEILSLYNVDGMPFSRMNGWVDVNGKDYSLLSITSETGNPVFIGSGYGGSGIASWGEQPFTVYSDSGFKANGLETKSNSTLVNNVRFSDAADDPQANLVNDQSYYKQFMVYGNKSLDGNSRKVGVADSLDVYGDMRALEWTTGKNVQGVDNVTAGNWAAWMRSDGTIEGETLTIRDSIKAEKIESRFGEFSSNVSASNLTAYERLCLNQSCLTQSDVDRFISNAPAPINALNQICINNTCMTESNLQKFLDPTPQPVNAADRVCINDTCLTQSDLKKMLLMINQPAAPVS